MTVITSALYLSESHLMATVVSSPPEYASAILLILAPTYSP
ncbi:MAG: hypothetical protein ACP5KY_04450 [Thermoproteus sp.]